MTPSAPEVAPPALGAAGAAEQPEQAALEVSGLCAGYGGPPIIENVSIRARRGAITAVVGPNGAGKSTLLKAIAGVIRPKSGTVVVEGSDVTGLAADRLVRRGVAYVPQVANVFPQLSVQENLEMGGYSRRHGVQERVHELYELFPDLGLAHRRRAETLSGGQRTMLAMARGLMVDPAVLILDEPSAGLSPKFQSTVWQRIEQVRATNVAVVVVEQNTRETLRHAAWAYVLVLGQNRLDGRGQDLLHNDEVVKLYVGVLTT